VSGHTDLHVVLQGASGYIREVQQLLRQGGLDSHVGAVPGSG